MMKDPGKDVKDESKSTTNTPIDFDSNSVENKLKQFLEDEKTKSATPPQLPSPKEMRTLLRALHNFPAQEDGDLELERASLVWGVERRGDWWFGEKYSKDRPASTEGGRGIFPGNYVEIVEKSGGSLRIENTPI